MSDFDLKTRLSRPVFGAKLAKVKDRKNLLIFHIKYYIRFVENLIIYILVPKIDDFD